MSNGKYPMIHRIRLEMVISLLFLFMVIPPALAHKVNLFAYVEGDRVVTESYFSDGKRCQNSIIEVFDRSQKKLLEGKTDKTGIFSFKVSGETDLRLVLNAGMGHRAEYTVSKSDFTVNSGKKDGKFSPIKPETVAAGSITSKEIDAPPLVSVDPGVLQLMIEESLENKLRPIMREIKKSRENKISVTEIIGGIGYIFGLMGVSVYFANRKNKKRGSLV